MFVSKAPWLSLLAALTVACASRAVPTRFPANSAAAPDSPAAAPARVTQALAGDLPLPGEPGAELLEPEGTPARSAPPGAEPGQLPHSQHGAHHHGH